MFESGLLIEQRRKSVRQRLPDDIRMTLVFQILKASLLSCRFDRGCNNLLSDILSLGYYLLKENGVEKFLVYPLTITI